MKSASQMEESSQQSQNNQHPLCFRCHRRLKTKESQVLGMGPVCYKKWQNEQNTKPLT